MTKEPNLSAVAVMGWGCKPEKAVSMREKMARAMYHAMIVRNAYVILDARDVTLTVHAWEHQPTGLHEDWLVAADAALDAMTELSDSVQDAIRSGDPYPSGRAMYVAAIRAIKEGK